MVAEEIVVSLSGGAPWGFRLQGGTELQKPLQVAKVRRRSKACRAGLREQDELVAIDDHLCSELSHAQAMSLIDTQSATLSLRVKRVTSGLHAAAHSGRSASPRAASSRVLSPPATPLNSGSSSILSPTGIPRGITSPPDSEAYYGETDSDADTQSHVHRRQRRTPPHARSPARYDNTEEEETSEMSGYESATDAAVSAQDRWDAQGLLGVPRRELVYQPLQPDWTTPAHTPHTLTPHTLTPTPDQVEAEGEGDSGFQEAGGCVTLACPPLVSPERAKEALMLSSGNQLVPMVGLQQTPVSDELSSSYMEKARQAKLQRGESLVEKQVKEARTKCRSIASLLTDAPNPNSKGVLMFKKRRQRAKKYTLTCFGKAEGHQGGDTEGETEGETEEEGGSSLQSGSEVDEEGFSSSFDSTWDSGYLDLLDRRSCACPPTTPVTPTAPVNNRSPGFDTPAYQSPGFLTTVNPSLALEVSENSVRQDSRPETGSVKQPTINHPAHMSPPAVALTNGGPVAVSRASVVLSPPSQMPLGSQNGQHANPDPHASLDPSSTPVTDLHSNTGLSPHAAYVNRTARPFAPGPTASRPSVTSVMFRPPQPKPTAITMETKPIAAVSMVTISPTYHTSGPDARRAVSSTSLYIPPRNNNSNTPPSMHSPPSALSPPSSLSSAPVPQLPANTFSPQPAGPASSYGVFSPAAHPIPQTCLPPPATPPTYFSAPAPTYPSTTCISSPPISSPHPPDFAQVAFSPHAVASASPAVQTPAVHPCSNVTGAATPRPQLSNAPVPLPQVLASNSLETREQRISVPAARTGILNDARRRSSKKPMFSAIQKKDVSVNPDLLSMVQNMDDRFGRPSGAESAVAPSTDAGHESGPEEDWLRLGAEACNFMQAQRASRPPPVAPKPQTPQVPQLAGKGGQLFARRQHRMDRYVVERSPSVAAVPYSPSQTREPSPTPSLPATWKYSSNIRAPPPISYNPLLSPSCPPKAQKKPEVQKSGKAGPKGQKAGSKPVDIMNHQPHQLSSSLFSYGGGVPQDTSPNQQQRSTTGGTHKTARVYEIKRFSTPPPASTGPALKAIVPRSATTLGEPLWQSEVMSPPSTAGTGLYGQQNPVVQPFPPQFTASPLSPTMPPAPTGPLPQLPTFCSSTSQAQSPSCSHPQPSSRQFKSAPDISPLNPPSSVTPSNRVPRPRFSTSNLGLQASVWRPGSTAH